MYTVTVSPVKQKGTGEEQLMRIVFWGEFSVSSLSFCGGHTYTAVRRRVCVRWVVGCWWPVACGLWAVGKFLPPQRERSTSSWTDDRE